MPVLRIVQQGFETYTGPMGDVEFLDGLSVESVSRGEARRLAGIFSIIDEATGKNPSVTQELVEQRNLNRAQLEEARLNQLREDVKNDQAFEDSNPDSSDENLTDDEEQSKVEVRFDFDRNKLERIADKSGIVGLRDFAAEYDVRGESIQKIIASLLAVQKEQQLAKEKEIKET